MKAKQRGFTLIELMIVVGIIAIIAAVGYPSYAAHPLKKLMDAGVRVTLNSDDPGLFNCTIGGEYQVAKDSFGLSNKELAQTTRTALEAAFVDEPTRAKLLAVVDNSGFLARARPQGPRSPQP